MSDYTPTTEEVLAHWDRSHTEVGAAALRRWLASVKANVWDEAKREVAMIPCWVNPETGLHGFDLHNETEQGARMEVMRVLDNNPYRKEQTDE